MKNENESVKQILDEWFSDIQNQNLDGVIKNHSDNIVIFDVPKPLLSKGLEEYKKTWELFFRNVKAGAESFQPIDLNIQEDNHVAFAFGLIKIYDSTVRLTIGLNKIDGKWKISHEHHSYPIDIEMQK